MNTILLVDLGINDDTDVLHPVHQEIKDDEQNIFEKLENEFDLL